MKASSIVVPCLASFALAEETSSPLTFTYMTFEDETVSTTTTTYGSGTNYPPPSPTVHATSYSPNPADWAYPTFPSYPLSVAEAPAAPGLQNATTFGLEALKLISLLKVANSTNCQLCKTIMSSIQATMKVQQEALSIIAEPFCQELSVALPVPICVGLLNVASIDVNGIFPAMDMTGDDGQTLCAYMFGTCDLPPVPKLNQTALFKGTRKPAPKTLKPCTKEPLKVLHFSDYHLDQRYVVGSEANCGGSLCCRVYPYTNTSVPINQSASLFGNYQCDTPEAMATSVFRAIPKVTGYTWDDFSFAIYTGDLVSHDLWELTKPYVISEELACYQQWFNGMGGVPVFPTLGNHDTFPHAFTSFPVEDGVLPANASYPIQQLYNYQNVASAWANYGWLDAAAAQTVVSSGLGIYRTVTKEGLVIISLNSDVWYYFNLYTYIQANVPDKTGMFSIMIDYLLEAEANDQAVWVIQHVNTGGSTDYEAIPAPTDLWYAIIDRFSNTIRGTFFGHTHEDEFSVIYSKNATVKSAETAVSVAYIMPSVTTYQNLNGGFRYYLVDPDTFQVMDSVTYYANVSDTYEWTAQGDVTWQFEYSARETYDYNGTLAADEPLTPAFWHSVAVDIANNATTYHTYTDLRTKLYRPYTPDTAAERNATICGLTSMSIPIYENCLNSIASTSSFL